MSYLFKLTKDGKTVGYLRIKEGKVWWQYTEYDKLVNACWYEVRTGKPIDFDTAHPFVCKDKNDKDVFGGDKVESMGGNRCLVAWHEVHQQWCLWHIEGDYYFGALTSNEDVELIEESKAGQMSKTQPQQATGRPQPTPTASKPAEAPQSPPEATEKITPDIEPETGVEKRQVADKVLEQAARKAARTGNVKDLREYLEMRRNR